VTRKGPTHGFLVDVARGAGAALIFSLPILMTSEMWLLGHTMTPFRITLFLMLLMPMLVGLSYFSGFEDVTSAAAHVREGFIAYVIGAATAVSFLSVFGLITRETPFREGLGMVTLQAIPASIGAMLARTQLGGEHVDDRKRREPRYGGELFLMVVGAIFVAFNIAPTEEVPLIAFRITGWQALAIAVISIVIMHTFIYALEFSGGSSVDNETRVGLFFRFSATGYAIALLTSAYVLWSFGRFDGVPPGEMVLMATVLALPATVGAAAARLIL